jgi:hypothetical protein
MQTEFSKIQFCRGLFRKVEILPLPCQYIPSLKLFIIDNPNNCQTGLEINGLHTRSKNKLLIPIARLKSVQKGITYSGIKIHNSLPSNILNLKNDRKQFKNELYRYLLNNFFTLPKNFWSSAEMINSINYFCCNLYCIVLL